MLPRLAMRQIIRQGGPTVFSENPKDRLARAQANAVILSMASDRVHVLDIEPLFVEGQGNIRFLDQEGRQLYHDSTHLSGHGTDLVREALETTLKSLVQPDR
jgi:lysophospholipase L1-like esterase